MWDSWNSMHERDERESWEQLRMQCLCTLQPWSKNSLEARDIMEFPWDEKQGKPTDSHAGHEEVLRRYREAKRQAGLK